MSATGFTGTLNNAYIIPQPTTGGPTGGNWINWTVNANTIQAIGPTGALTTAMNFVVGGTGYATLSATGFVLTNPPVNGDSSNKVATTAWVMSNAPGGVGGATLAANQTFTGANTFNQDLRVNGITVGEGANNVATNTALGSSTLAANTSGGTNNVAVGASALSANTSGSNNTAVGSSALLTNQTGANNVAVGDAACQFQTNSANTAFGSNALRGTSGSSTGGNNTAVGLYSLWSNTTASNNTAVGTRALQSNTTGTPNTAVGVNALNANLTGINNVAVGDNALRLVTTTNNNTAVGSGTGQTLTGSGCTYIGANIVASTAGVLNEVVIGQGITGAGQNTVAIGTNGTTYATLSSAGLVGVRSIQAVQIISGSGTVGINNGTTGQTYNFQGVKSMIVRMVGGGAGGGGNAGGTPTRVPGQNGFETTFQQTGQTAYIAGGGVGGASTSGAGASDTSLNGNGQLGGTTTLGTFANGTTVIVLVQIRGGSSGAGINSVLYGTIYLVGGAGGYTPPFGTPSNQLYLSSENFNGAAGVGYGSGGTGASGKNGNTWSPGGGSAGGYLELLWQIPFNTAQTFSYTIAGTTVGGYCTPATNNNTTGGGGAGGCVELILFS